jgi:hypothetical protein
MLPSPATEGGKSESLRLGGQPIGCEAQCDLVFARAREHFRTSATPFKTSATDRRGPPNRNFETPQGRRRVRAASSRSTLCAYERPREHRSLRRDRRGRGAGTCGQACASPTPLPP